MPEPARSALLRALDYELSAAVCADDPESYGKFTALARNYFGLYFLFLSQHENRYASRVQLVHTAQLGDLEARVSALEAAGDDL